MTFSEQLKADIALVEPALEKYLSRETGEGYDRIFEAAKYSAMAGGKRLRPVIVLEFCRLCGGDIEKALPFACALESIPTRSSTMTFRVWTTTTCAAADRPATRLSMKRRRSSRVTDC